VRRLKSYFVLCDGKGENLAIRRRKQETTWLDDLEKQAVVNQGSTKPEVRRDAKMIASLCRKVRKHVANGAIKSLEAAYLPYLLGSQASSIKSRFVEADADLGRQVRANRIKGGKARAAQRRASWKYWQRRVDSYMERLEPTAKNHRYACRMVEKDVWDTLQQATFQSIYARTRPRGR